jgi:hypothetical protein
MCDQASPLTGRRSIKRSKLSVDESHLRLRPLEISFQKVAMTNNRPFPPRWVPLFSLVGGRPIGFSISEFEIGDFLEGLVKIGSHA